MCILLYEHVFTLRRRGAQKHVSYYSSPGEILFILFNISSENIESWHMSDSLEITTREGLVGSVVFLLHFESCSHIEINTNMSIVFSSDMQRIAKKNAGNLKLLTFSSKI